MINVCSYVHFFLHHNIHVDIFYAIEIDYNHKGQKEKKLHNYNFFPCMFILRQATILGKSIRLIDWIEFYTVSALFQPCNGGKSIRKYYDLSFNIIIV